VCVSLPPSSANGPLRTWRIGPFALLGGRLTHTRE